MKKFTLTRSAAVALFVALGIGTAEKWNNKRIEAKLAKVDEMIDDDTKLPKAEDAVLNKLLKAIEDEVEIEVVDDAPADADAPKKKGKPQSKAEEPEEAPKAKGKGGKPAPVAEDVEEALSPEAAFEALKDRYDNGEITAAEFKAERAKLPKAKKPTAPAKPVKEKPVKAEAPAKPVDFRDKKAAPEKAPKAEKLAKVKPEVEAPEVSRIPRVRSTETRPYLAGVIIKEYGLEVGVTDEMIAELDRRYGTNKPRECAHILRHAWHSVRGFLSE